MKEKLKLTKLTAVCLWLLLLICGTIMPMFSAESKTSYMLTLRKHGNESMKDDQSSTKQRSPQIGIICYISEENGIQIGTETASIYSYELWDEAGETCVAAFSEESDFISFLFANPGNYQLRFLTDEYTLVGFL